MKNKNLETLLGKARAGRASGAIKTAALALSLFLSGCIEDVESLTEDKADSKPLTTPSDCIYIHEFHYDAEGRDNQNMNDEYVIFGNRCDTPMPMARWTVEDLSKQSYSFPLFTLPENQFAYLHSGMGEDWNEHLFWNSRIYPIWNNTGDMLTLKNAKGELVLQEGYTSK